MGYIGGNPLGRYEMTRRFCEIGSFEGLAETDRRLLTSRRRVSQIS
jgi:hypothetical protein